jgi:hypothetical protein
VRIEAGELKLRADAFDDKAGLRLKSVTFKGKRIEAEVREDAEAP